MSSNISSSVLLNLEHKISKTAAVASDLGFLSSPDKDFSRVRKLTMSHVMKLILSMAGGTLFDSLCSYFGIFESDIPTASAFVQAREKIKPDAFRYLFDLMNKTYSCSETFKDFHLIAVDGSDINIPVDPNDTDTLLKAAEGFKQSSQYHLNCAYDILEKRYIDAIIQPYRNQNEISAMKSMIEHYSNQYAIFIADRGYPSWNLMALCDSLSKYYLIRDMDIHSSTSRLRKFDLPDSEFDEILTITLTTKQTKYIMDHPDLYRYLSTTSKFDFFDDDGFYTISFRAVRFKISDDTYESIITNIPQSVLNASQIKELYHLRWKIEVSYRELKYASDLVCFHCRKRQSLLQEIWASLIMYNVSTIICKRLTSDKIKKRKHDYQINLTTTMKIIRNYLYIKSPEERPPELDLLILKHLLPVRAGRKFTRKMRTQHVVYFNYRFA